jgi:hypothetical protein
LNSSLPSIAGTEAKAQAIDLVVVFHEARTFREHYLSTTGRSPVFFTFPEDAHWDVERRAVEFAVEIGEYRGVVRVQRRVFQRLLPEERCVEAY